MLTGYAATDSSDQSKFPGTYGTDASVTLPYNTSAGYKASTTGNITGIYDFSFILLSFRYGMFSLNPQRSIFHRIFIFFSSMSIIFICSRAIQIGKKYRYSSKVYIASYIAYSFNTCMSILE